MARLAQSAERKALNLVVMGSSPTVGVSFIWPQRLMRFARLARFTRSVSRCADPSACGETVARVA